MYVHKKLTHLLWILSFLSFLSFHRSFFRAFAPIWQNLAYSTSWWLWPLQVSADTEHDKCGESPEAACNAQEESEKRHKSFWVSLQNAIRKKKLMFAAEPAATPPTKNKPKQSNKQNTKQKKNTKQTKKDETKHDEPKPDSKTSKTLQGSKPGQRTKRTKPTKPINKISFKIRKSWPQGESKDSKALAEWSRKNDSRQSISEPGDTKQCSTYEDMYDK